MKSYPPKQYKAEYEMDIPDSWSVSNKQSKTHNKALRVNRKAIREGKRGWRE